MKYYNDLPKSFDGFLILLQFPTPSLTHNKKDRDLLLEDLRSLYILMHEFAGYYDDPKNTNIL